MSIQNVPYSPARTLRQTPQATPPRNSSLSTTPNTSPAPRVPLGRSPQRTSSYTPQPTNEAIPVEGETAGRTSIDSAAIFSIYSMYGSESGGGVVSAQNAGRRESQGPAGRFASTYSNASRTSTPSQYSVYEVHSGGHATPSHSISGYVGQIQHQHDLPAAHTYRLDPRRQSQEQRTLPTPATPFQSPRQADTDSGDNYFRSSPRTGSAVTPSGGMNGSDPFTRSSLPTSTRTDEEDDDSLTLDIEIGSTIAGGSNPSSPTTGSMSFFPSPSKIKMGKAKSTTSTASESELPYFDTGVMPLVPPPPNGPSSWASAEGVRENGVSPKDDFGDRPNGRFNDGMNVENSNRMSMSSWLHGPTRLIGRLPNGVRPASNLSLPQPATSPSLQPECQPHGSLQVVPPPQLPPLQRSLSTTSTHSHSSSVYATPISVLSPTSIPILGELQDRDSVDSPAAMHTNNGRYHPPSLSSSRRNSPSPSLPSGQTPPTSYQHHHQSNPGSRRQTPSPAPSRTGSSVVPTPSIIYPQSQDHSPHSSLSHNSTQSHHSYGASSVITRDTAVSAISGTTATTSGSGVEQATPPLPVFLQHERLLQQRQYEMLSQSPQQSQTGTASIPSPGRISLASSNYSSSQAHQSYVSSAGHGSVGLGELQIPRVDKDLPQMPAPLMDRSFGVNYRTSGQSNGMRGGGERRASPVPSLSVNGSPHHSLMLGGSGSLRESGKRQTRLIPVGLGGPPMGSVSPSVSQQSTATTATTGTIATVSSTGATTANSTPDPNGAGQSVMIMNSPHASLTPHQSLSSMRNKLINKNSPHQSLASNSQFCGKDLGGSMKARSTPSLVPSVGEDLDAFHVRNTYAQLEVSGVKGDGYEEGVERTRAARTRAASRSPSPSAGGADTSGSAEDGSSVGHARARRTKSQVLADSAIADENEKKRELDPNEIQILGSLDRYGFFTVPSHDRLLLVPSQPLLKPLPFSPAAAASATPPSNNNNAPSSPSQYPASGASATPRTLSALPQVVTPGKEAARISKWGRMLMPHERDEGGNVQAWRIRPSKVGKVRRRTYKGIPDRWRAAAWEVMMTAYSNASAEGGESSRKSNEKVGSVPVETILRQMSSTAAASWGVREEEGTGREYRDALEKPSSYDIQIDLDVPRTISGHIMFRTRYGAGQRSLFHVLHSFSLRCPSCGYVQGMGPIAATLLSYMSPSLAYTSLVRLHDAYSMHSVFAPGFPGLLEAIYVQERLTQATMPNVYAAFQKHMISTTSYATKWYITLFANSVPFQTQLRLWDVFLLEGYDVYVAVAIAVVWVYKDHITSASANFETVLSLLSGFFVPEDEDVLLEWVGKMLGDRRVRSAMQEWRKEWRELVRQGKDGSALL